IIKGKVAVQRAYADWRRYPQYIVPLSEASIDLIFAPAYGSNKKNATDIRMAIDGMELVFTRPEIGTFILLTGDSDFSSLVLKLKEYGKYVIGVGIQESSSDILVQNCDEYYSYTSLAGLRKTTDADTEAVDPWLLVEKALDRMQSRNDVMRSDRLKQVMLEIDSGFDESEYGFSKFSRFLTEAASKDLVDLKRMDNGQYEVRPTKGTSGRAASGGGGRGGGRSESGRRESGRSGDGRGRQETKAAAPAPIPSSGERTRGRATRSRTRPGGRDRTAAKPEETGGEPSGKTGREGGGKVAAEPDERGDPLQEAYDLLTSAVERLTRERDIPAVRDSDVKRKMLEADRSFDEGELGFSKFSLFLQQADEHDVIDLRKRESGNYEVALPGTEGEQPEAEAEETEVSEAREEREEKEAEAAEPEDEGKARQRRDVQEILDRHRVSTRREEAPEASESEDEGEAGAEEPSPDEAEAEAEEAAAEATEVGEEAEEAAPTPSTGRGLGPRRGERPGRRSKKADSGPPILPGQIVQKGASGQKSPGGDRGSSGAGAPGPTGAGVATAPSTEVVAPEQLGLPTDEESVIRYLTNSYKGVGEKTAETLVEELGSDLFSVLQRQPERIRDVLPSNRAEQLLDAWQEDLSRRKERAREGE
ncbi:MAG: NYN domain-containing protein, partial [Longimicrobiales bacterium]|nr:NYN domain-containing protein [Longimicrobiales bacterium]